MRSSRPMRSSSPSRTTIMCGAAGRWSTRLLKGGKGIVLDVKSRARPRRRSPTASSCGGYEQRRVSRTNTREPFWSPARPASSAFMSRAGCWPKAASVVGIDNMSAYYDPALKEARRAELAKINNFTFRQARSRRSRRRGRAVRRASISALWCISPRRPACAIRSSIRMPMSTPISGLHQYPGRLPPQRLPASAVCVVVVGLRRQHQAAVLASTTMSIIRSASTPRARRRTS